MNTLTLEQVSFSYNGKDRILDNITFSAEAGETIGVIGANGAGKTTLLKLLVGLLLPDAGTISVSGTRLSKETLTDIRKKIGYVFQDSDSQLFMSTAYDDIAFGPRNYGFPEEEVAERVEKAMELTHSSYLRDRQIHKMSGGEKKLISIATILSLDPELIIMDEPSNALDPQNRRNLIRVLNSLPCTKLIAAHDLDLVWDTCSRVILLGSGKIIAEGNTKELLTKEELLNANNLELPLSAKLHLLKEGRA